MGWSPGDVGVAAAGGGMVAVWLVSLGGGLGGGGSGPPVRFLATAVLLSFRGVEDEELHTQPVAQRRVQTVGDEPADPAITLRENVTTGIRALLEPSGIPLPFPAPLLGAGHCSPRSRGLRKARFGRGQSRLFAEK